MPVKQGSGIKKSGRVFGQGKKTAKTVRAGLYARVSTQDQRTLHDESLMAEKDTLRPCAGSIVKCP